MFCEIFGYLLSLTDVSDLQPGDQPVTSAGHDTPQLLLALPVQTRSEGDHSDDLPDELSVHVCHPARLVAAADVDVAPDVCQVGLAKLQDGHESWHRVLQLRGV